MDYNQAQLTSYQRLTDYELSTTQNLSSTYLSHRLPTLARVTLARPPAVSLRLPRLTWARGCK
jgi:hypothetical protein